MAEVDARIPMGFGQPPTLGPDYGTMIANAQQTMQLQEQQRQVEQANALRNILGRPGAIGPLGVPTPDALSQVYKVAPEVGMKIQQGTNALALQQTQIQEHQQKRYQTIQDMVDPIRTAAIRLYNDTPGSTEAKQRAAQNYMGPELEKLRVGGGLTPEEAQRLPTAFDIRTATANSDTWQKQQEQLRKETRLEKHDETMNQRAGTTVLKDADGKPYIVQPNAGPGQPKATYLDGTAVSDEKITGSTKMGTGRTPVAALDRDAIAGIVKQSYEAELGRPVNMGDPAEKAEFDRRVLTAEDKRKIDLRATPVAAQDRKATEGIVREGYEKELGRPIDAKSTSEQNELNRRVQAAEDRRKAQLAGDRTSATTKARQDAETLGVPETPEAKTSLAAQAATGQPLNQIVMGYGKLAVQARKEAREGAIDKIMVDTGMNASQAGIELAMRGIDFATGKRSDAQLGTIRGATVAAVKQLDYNVDQVLEDFKKLPGTDLSPIINAIVRGEQNITGDPEYKKLFFHMQAVANESARILSGGQASIAQLAEGARKEAEKWAGVNMTPASFKAVAQAMHEEGQARIRSFDEARGEQRLGGAPPTPSPGSRRAVGTPEPEKAWPTPPTQAIEDLKRERANPIYTQSFDKHFGPGAAERALGGGEAPTSLAPPAATKPAASATPANPADLPDDARVKQGGKTYRKQGNEWIEVK